MFYIAPLTDYPSLAMQHGDNQFNNMYDDLIKAQAYIIQHQQDLMNNLVRRNTDLVKAMNQCEKENGTLRLKLKGHEQGKLWTILWAMMPTRDMIEPK